MTQQTLINLAPFFRAERLIEIFQVVNKAFNLLALFEQQQNAQAWPGQMRSLSSEPVPGLQDASSDATRRILEVKSWLEACTGTNVALDPSNPRGLFNIALLSLPPDLDKELRIALQASVSRRLQRRYAAAQRKAA